jgi:hypothetical protein
MGLIQQKGYIVDDTQAGRVSLGNRRLGVVGNVRLGYGN